MPNDISYRSHQIAINAIAHNAADDGPDPAMLANPDMTGSAALARHRLYRWTCSARGLVGSLMQPRPHPVRRTMSPAHCWRPRLR